MPFNILKVEHGLVFKLSNSLTDRANPNAKYVPEVTQLLLVVITDAT
jgi:hypothetical protein